MKRKRLALLCLAAILMLLGGFHLMWIQQKKNTEALERTERAQSEADAALRAVYRSESEAEFSDESQKPEENSSLALLSDSDDIPVIWVGDSRTVGMKKAMAGDTEDIFIAASGEGYEWFAATGLAQLETAMEENPERAVVFNLGVNDDENLDNYLSIYRTLLQEHAETVFWFLSVNPIDPERCSAITNDEIEYFNEKIQEAFPGQYLDSFSWLDGSETSDGIHYTKEQYRQIYVFVKKALTEQTQ